MEEEDRKLIYWGMVIVLVFIFVLLIGTLLKNSRVEFEADCGIGGLNFNFNETYNIENFSLQDASVHCKFKGNVPMGIFLRGLE